MTSPPFNASLIGFGYWGPNLARNLSASSDYELKFICDTSAQRLESAQRQYPWVTCTPNTTGALSNPEIDVVFIATPAATHLQLAAEAISHGKHVLVEKPLALDSRSAASLIEMARNHDVLLVVDHTFVFTDAVRRLRDSVEGGEVGELQYFDSTRFNLGLVQPDIDVLWDLAVHDLSILQFVTGRKPSSVSATGMAHSPSAHPSTAYLTLFYEDDFIAHIGASWMSPVKIRRTLLAGSRRMVVYDDLEPSEKIKIYDSGVERPPTVETTHRLLIQYRTGDMVAPRLGTREALAVEVDHIAACLRGESEPLVPGRMGLEIVMTLEAASQSLKQHGEPVEVGGVEG